MPGLRYTGRAVSARREDAGNTGSFEELAMPHFARLFNLACWLTRDRSEAEELVQETFMKALKGFRSFEQGTNFKAWMYRILRNTFLTSRTGLKSCVSLDDEPLLEPETGDDPEVLFLAQLDRERIHVALDQLPVAFREVILLCDLEEMSYREIAETLAIPTGTVMSRLWRARRAMRTLLEAAR
jgi:RNA polymerase sigma-70 factor (ECF subfamily)